MLLTQEQIEQSEKLQRLHKELEAAGVIFSSLNYAGTLQRLQAGQEALAALVIAARDKTLASAECIAVRTALGGASDPRWIAYAAVRQEPIKRQRLERFINEVLPLLLDLHKDTEEETHGQGKKTLAFKDEKLIAFKSKYEEIMNATPETQMVEKKN
jgi:hypothetical protein